ncbi:MAG: phage holin family protein [Clostridiales bacterium]|nr:phage holin family protein [Clostridiales bacterium]
MKLLIKWLICTGSLWITSILFPSGIEFNGNWAVILAAGTVLWIANLFIRPVLQIISLPLTLITLGLFSIIVNAGIISAVGALLPVMSIKSFWYCIFISLIISAGNAIFT